MSSGPKTFGQWAALGLCAFGDEVLAEIGGQYCTSEDLYALKNFSSAQILDAIRDGQSSEIDGVIEYLVINKNWASRARPTVDEVSVALNGHHCFGPDDPHLVELLRLWLLAGPGLTQEIFKALANQIVAATSTAMNAAV